MKTLALTAAVVAGCATGGPDHSRHEHHPMTAEDAAPLRGAATTCLSLSSGGDPANAWGTGEHRLCARDGQWRLDPLNTTTCGAP
ncbi:hypothetical protein [Nocardia sp. NRRL S-836]|uniref:hypothetical protein n=1 Tax=Nocardia sp. NRRL S-836 TaxID=1519492 RepID=UPI0006AEA54A|nr:hypothetical protein [Nocardia sp. NRRL S-836]